MREEDDAFENILFHFSAETQKVDLFGAFYLANKGQTISCLNKEGGIRQEIKKPAFPKKTRVEGIVGDYELISTLTVFGLASSFLGKPTVRTPFSSLAEILSGSTPSPILKERSKLLRLNSRIR